MDLGFRDGSDVGDITVDEVYVGDMDFELGLDERSDADRLSVGDLTSSGDLGLEVEVDGESDMGYVDVGGVKVGGELGVDVEADDRSDISGVDVSGVYAGDVDIDASADDDSGVDVDVRDVVVRDDLDVDVRAYDESDVDVYVDGVRVGDRVDVGVSSSGDADGYMYVGGVVSEDFKGKVDARRGGEAYLRIDGVSAGDQFRTYDEEEDKSDVIDISNVTAGNAKIKGGARFIRNLFTPGWLYIGNPENTNLSNVVGGERVLLDSYKDFTLDELDRILSNVGGGNFRIGRELFKRETLEQDIYAAKMLEAELEVSEEKVPESEVEPEGNPEVEIKDGRLRVLNPKEGDGNYLVYSTFDYGKLKDLFDSDPTQMTAQQVFNVIYGADNIHNPYHDPEEHKVSVRDGLLYIPKPDGGEEVYGYDPSSFSKNPEDMTPAEVRGRLEKLRLYDLIKQQRLQSLDPMSPITTTTTTTTEGYTVTVTTTDGYWGLVPTTTSIPPEVDYDSNIWRDTIFPTAESIVEGVCNSTSTI